MSHWAALFDLRTVKGDTLGPPASIAAFCRLWAMSGAEETMISFSWARVMAT